MPINLKYKKVEPLKAVHAVNETLRHIDARLVDHGSRVAYIACEIMKEGNLPFDLKTLFLLCVFHDIGAYKTEEIDRMVEFETKKVWNHSIYGYLFLKNLSPLKNAAEAILYHHTVWENLKKVNSDYTDYAAIIHLADRVDIAAHYINSNEKYLESVINNADGIFKPEYAALLKRRYEKGGIIENVLNGGYSHINIETCKEFNPTVAEAVEFLKMIVYTIDFRSEHTVTHTVDTTFLAGAFARAFNLSEEDCENVYLGALLHDVGKIAIPSSILESKGRLDDNEMAIMRTHVQETEKIIRGSIPDEVCEIAIRHHEKLDGSGYPRGLKAENLNFCERIVAVADIVSALSTQRSYKEPFPKEKTIGILRDMQGVKLDSKTCDYVIDNYDSLVKESEPKRRDIIEKYQAIKDEFKNISENLIDILG